MRVIKIILGIISVLVIMFFATGLVIKDTKYTTEIEINKPINEVFLAFENVDLMKEWLPEIQSIEPIEEKEGKVGSTYNVVVDNKGKTIKMVEKILAYVPNEKITFLFNSEQMLKTDDYNFIANGNSTRIIQHSSAKSTSYMMSCIFPYFKGILQETSQGYLNRFKEVVEK